ncbi:MAG: hypothetical protein EZS28_011580 [Streblomastix strix]|uniref:Uncharacterized protein n=1 Tax=Streblomastix strix TaxID=222440 RepID=A0A5J4WD84_9EUKA|nr:MAG: hypothetical protein EZS28_011580 [Streblomastix strix]
MSACANAIKYALAYFDFKLDQDYTPKDDYASFILTQNYWNIKVQNYHEQDKRRNTDTSNNIKESDCAFYRKLFLSTGCHICKARFTSKNPPTLDRNNNDRGHSADNDYRKSCIAIIKDTDYIMIHLLMLDFNCKYPSVMSSEPHNFRYEQNALYLWRYRFDDMDHQRQPRRGLQTEIQIRKRGLEIL